MLMIPQIHQFSLWQFLRREKNMHQTGDLGFAKISDRVLTLLWESQISMLCSVLGMS